MNQLLRSIAILLALLTVVNPVFADSRLPYPDANSLQSLNQDEQRIWSASRDFEKAILKGGQIYPSPELEAYLQSIMDKLYPEFAGSIKVHVIKSPVLNAFAIPSGQIYINTGLLSRFDNEAQLATVLAHEGAHFVYRHGYFNQQSLKGASAFATITAVIGVPIVGLLGNVIAMSSIYGYSRELETEADNVGFERLSKAGYDLNEASKVFEHLAAEVKLSGTDESFFYSTHPKLQDRVENYTKLAATHSSEGLNNNEIYKSKIDKIRFEDLDLELSFGRYKHIIALLSEEKVLKRYPSTVQYYLGEAYRKRNDKGDSALAIIALDKAIQTNPEFALSYRSKAMLMMAEKNNQDAISLFSHYLELEPNASDKSYVAEYITTLNQNK